MLKPGISKELLMTLVVVIYLRSVMANRKSSWSRIGEKADGYVAANIGNNGQFEPQYDHTGSFNSRVLDTSLIEGFQILVFVSPHLQCSCYYHGS